MAAVIPVTFAAVKAANCCIFARTAGIPLSVGSWDIKAAANPATWGEAMLVPLRTAVSVLLLMPTLRTFTPGPKISTSGPKFENDAFLSVWSIAPTVMAPVADPGEVFAVSCYL